MITSIDMTVKRSFQIENVLKAFDTKAPDGLAKDAIAKLYLEGFYRYVEDGYLLSTLLEEEKRMRESAIP